MQFLRGLLRAYSMAAGYLLALAAVIVATLVLRGALSKEELRSAWAALRSRPEAAQPRPEDRKTPAEARERERILEQRTQELRKLEDRVGAKMELLRAEQDALEAKRKEALAALEQTAKAREEFAQVKSDAELSANVPILSRMDAAGIVSFLKSGDDARFVRTLRALRPGKAAEVLEAIQTDPRFEDEFRRVPPGSPPGTKTRAERLYEEFDKAP